MRLMTSQHTGELAVIGSIASVRIGPGATVDVDQVVGESGGTPCTVASELGGLLNRFTPVETAPAAARAPKAKGE